MNMLGVLVQGELNQEVFAGLVFVELVCGKPNAAAPLGEFGFPIPSASRSVVMPQSELSCVPL